MKPNPSFVHLCDILLVAMIGRLEGALARGDFGPSEALREASWLSAARDELKLRRAALPP